MTDLFSHAKVRLFTEIAKQLSIFFTEETKICRLSVFGCWFSLGKDNKITVIRLLGYKVVRKIQTALANLRITE